MNLTLADFQETHNNENVAQILPNTRDVSVTITVR